MSPDEDLHTSILEWYDTAARDLPWRRPGTPAWAILVSEVMLQQTPVARVLPVWDAWMRRWPDAASLARESTGEAVRAWGRLGYPRRAVRLHAAAAAVVERHGGAVPDDYDELRALPGVGDYTAAAVLSFAYGQRHVVLDTNVRRLYARLVTGQQFPARSITRTERELAGALLPSDRAARWAVATMELGALICTAASPSCDRCPVRASCAWDSAGRPPATRAPAQPRYEGSDRQARGLLLATLRTSAAAVPGGVLLASCPDAVQAQRCLDSLLKDGLVERCGDTYVLPGCGATT